MLIIFAEEEQEFNQEWQNKARQFQPNSAQQSIGYRHSNLYNNYEQEQLALPPSSRY